MDLSLPSEDLAWKERAKVFAETILFPQELELELNGSLPRATKNALRAAVIEHGFNGINHSRDVGGQGCTQLQQTLINEELGKATGALWAVVWHPAVALKHGCADQIRKSMGSPLPPSDKLTVDQASDSARATLRSIRSSSVSSKVPAQTYLWTCTLRVWPMRKARSVA